MPKATIMIVEDEWIIADDLRSCLEGMDYRVSSIVASGEEAVARVEKDRPDLVLMDIILKEKMNGIEAAESIQRRFNVPHIFITAYGDEATLEKAKLTEPYGYLLKPFDDRELNAVIETALYKYKMEAKLKESEERFKGLVETTSDWIWEVDENAVYTYASPRVRDILGYNPEEILGMKPFDFMPRDEAKRVADLFDTIARSQKEFKRLENINLRKDGSPVVLETSGVPLFDSEGAFRGYRGIDRDISDRKWAEELLKNKNQLLLNVIESLTHPFYVINVKDYTLELANSAARKNGTSGATTCYALSHHRSEPCEGYGHPCVLEEIKRTRSAAVVEHVHYDGTGNSSIVEVHGYPVFNEDGDVVQIIEYNLDITDRKKAEQEREQLNAELQQKNKEMEQFLYVTSHDLRTPLAIVQGYARELDFTFDQLMSEMGADAAFSGLRTRLSPYINDMKDTGKYIWSNIKKMDALLYGLLKLSRSGNVELNMQEIDMNRLAAEVRDSFAYKINESGATVHISALPGCIGDVNQINQVFSNLLGNALKYLDPGRPGFITVTGRSESGTSVYCIEDNGVGIQKSELEKIFNIFYQSNASIAGEGLGLSIVKKILERHDGRIWVESSPDRGSRLYVQLPA